MAFNCDDREVLFWVSSSPPHTEGPLEPPGLSCWTMAFSFRPAGFLCFGVLFVMPILLFHLVSVCFFFPGLVSGMRRRKRKKNSQSRSPIQRRRERTMPSVRARTGTEGWAHLGSDEKPDSFLIDHLLSLLHHDLLSFASSQGQPLTSLCTSHRTVEIACTLHSNTACVAMATIYRGEKKAHHWFPKHPFLHHQGICLTTLMVITKTYLHLGGLSKMDHS